MDNLYFTSDVLLTKQQAGRFNELREQLANTTTAMQQAERRYIDSVAEVRRLLDRLVYMKRARSLLTVREAGVEDLTGSKAWRHDELWGLLREAEQSAADAAGTYRTAHMRLSDIRAAQTALTELGRQQRAGIKPVPVDDPALDQPVLRILGAPGEGLS